MCHAKSESVLKVQAPEMSTVAVDTDENLLNTLWTNAQKNRKLTSDSYKNETHHMVYQKKKCA
jgi:hypothetical protein